MNLVDSHCHLDDRQFDTDRDATIARAFESGLKYLLAIGTGDGPPDLEAAVRLAERHEKIWATAGVHPNDAQKAQPDTLGHLRSVLHHPKVVALGEIGLDYHYDVPRDLQHEIFIRQMELAAEARLPIVVHTREAWEDTLMLLRQHWQPKGLPGVMHCFTGSAEIARQCLDLGFHISFGGVLTFPKAVEVREAAQIVPADRLLVETDAPYLAPIPYRGKRNEPAFVIHTAKKLAEIRGESFEFLANQTTSNFEKLFGLDP